MLSTAQECGGIALPEQLRRRTGLASIAAFQIEVAEDGWRVARSPIQRMYSAGTNPGAQCVSKSEK
jgi:hypothetical protein